MSSFTKCGLATICVLLVLFGFQNCAPAKFQNGVTETNNASLASRSADINMGIESILLSGKSSTKNPHKCVKSGNDCYSETFKQPLVGTKAVDVLFVVQTSASVAAERQAIVAGIDDFITSLPAGSNFNIAVMLAHGSTSIESGRLFKAAGEPIVLKSSELTNAQIQTYLNTKLNQVVVDNDSGGGEEGLYSLYNGLATPALLAASQAQGFFRPEAALGIVFVADRRDICAMVPAGVAAEADPVKLAARIRDCEGLTAVGLTTRLKVLKGAMPVAVSGIIYADAPAPAGNEIGYGYTDMIALSPGLAIDIANDDISEGLASIGQLSGLQMAVQSEYVLEYTGVDSKKIIVTVNGVGVPFVLNGNKVKIKSKIPAGATVIIAYCLKSKVGSNGCHRRLDKKNKGHH